LSGLQLGFPSAAMLSEDLSFSIGERLKHTWTDCRGSLMS
jgi:hypothetical protein